MLAVKVNKRTIFVRVGGKGKLEMVDSLSDETAMSDSLPVADNQEAFASVHHEGSKINLMVKLVNDLDTVLLKESIQMNQHRGRVHKVFINNYIRTDRSNGFRALIVMEDHSLLLLQQGAIVWSREEGLASVVDATTAELPVEKDGVSVAKVEYVQLFEWLKLAGADQVQVHLVYTVKELSSSDIGHSVVQVLPLPFTDSTEQRLHLITDTVGHVHLYPKTSEAVSIFQREFQNVYWYTVEADDGIIRGHVMKDSCSGETAEVQMSTALLPGNSGLLCSLLNQRK